MSRPGKNILIPAAVLAVITIAVIARWLVPDSVDPSNETTVQKASGDSDSTMRVTVVTPQARNRQNALRADFDPANDGWISESINDSVTAHFKTISRIWPTERPFRDDDLARLTSSKFHCHPLRPSQLDTVYESRSITVQRGTTVDSEHRDQDTGTGRLAVALNHLRSSFAGFSGVRVKFKTTGVKISGQVVTTDVLYEGFGEKKESSLQQNANWQVTWTFDPSSAELRMLSIDVLSHDEVAVSGRRPTLFSDCTEAVLGSNSSFRDQLRHGSGYWMQRLDGHLSPRLLEGHIGFAMGDVNNDGLEDLYICQPGGLPNRLYIQNRDGTVTDSTSEAGLDVLDWSHSALIVDLNNDGYQDVAVLTDLLLLIFAGDGSGRFSRKASLHGTLEYALSAADFDNDGDLDLYACNYFAESSEELAQLSRTDPCLIRTPVGAMCFSVTRVNGRFVDATEEVGLDVNNQRWSLAAAWEDDDNDGDQDLYVVNDFGHNSLYRNEGGQFTEVAAASGAVDANQGMSVSWADFNRDGWMDVYVSNMFSAAGNRVTFQPSFLSSLPQDKRRLYQQLARGNTLLENLGDGAYRDVSIERGVTMGRWAWASLFADVNNDGWEDLLIANGYLTQDSKDDL